MVRIKSTTHLEIQQEEMGCELQVAPSPLVGVTMGTPIQNGCEYGYARASMEAEI